MAVNAAGHLIFAGLDTVSLAERYGTPLYLTDEGKIRENLHVFKNAIANYFPCGSAVYYAGKAFCCRAMYRILKDEEVGADVVSAGVKFTPPQRPVFLWSAAFFTAITRPTAI